MVEGLLQQAVVPRVLLHCWRMGNLAGRGAASHPTVPLCAGWRLFWKVKNVPFPSCHRREDVAQPCRPQEPSVLLSVMKKMHVSALTPSLGAAPSVPPRLSASPRKPKH